MYIKHLTGARKGETEEFPFTIARDKVMRGEALDVYDQLHLKSNPTTPAAQAPAAIIQPEVQSNRVDATEIGAALKRSKSALRSRFNEGGRRER